MRRAPTTSCTTPLVGLLTSWAASSGSCPARTLLTSPSPRSLQRRSGRSFGPPADAPVGRRAMYYPHWSHVVGGCLVKKVMVATDRSQSATRAVDWAADMASRFGAELHLLQVLVPEHTPGTEAGAAKATR